MLCDISQCVANIKFVNIYRRIILIHDYRNKDCKNISEWCIHLKSFDWIIAMAFWGERDCSVFSCHLRNSIKGALSGCRHYPVNGFCVTGFYGMRLPYHDGIFAQEKSLSTLI